MKSKLTRVLGASLAIAIGCGVATVVMDTHDPSTQGDSRAIAGEPGTDPNIFVNLSRRVVPSVVNISTLSVVKSPLGRQDDLFRRFFDEFFRQHPGMEPPPQDDQGEDEGEDNSQPSQPQNPKEAPRAMALGTGFIIDSKGLILTNNHVVAGADEIKIYFTEDPLERPTDGKVVGRDPELDLALIKVKTDRKLVPIALGDSDAAQVGEYVMAVGNPFGQGHSVTHGIISAKGRRAPDFQLASYIQTDAPINPGNSGGPLVNLRGEVIGINNAIEQRAQGIGFAIPINLVKTVLPQLETKGTVQRGYIGVLIDEMTPEIAAQLKFPKNRTAPFVTHVYPNAPADRAGVKPYDVVVAFNGKPVTSGGELVRAVTAVPVNQSVPITVWRNGREKKLTIKVSQRPGEKQASAEQQRKRSKKKKKAHVETGMELEDITPDIARDLGLPEDSQGIVVTDVTYGSPADNAGLGRGDIIIEVDRKKVDSVDAFYKSVNAKKSYLLRVRRVDPQGNDAFAVVVLDLSK